MLCPAIGPLISQSKEFTHGRYRAHRFVIVIPCLCTLVGVVVGSWLHFPVGYVLIAGLAVFFLVALGSGIWAWASYIRFTQRNKHLARTPPADARLVCIGDPGTLLEFGPFGDVAFEPALFSSSLVIRPHRWRTWVGPIGYTVVILVAFITFFPFIGFVPLFGGMNVLVGNLVFPVLAVGFESAAAFLWPSYLRLVPGRLDLIRYGFLGRGVLSETRVGLRRAAIQVDLCNSYVDVTGPDGSVGLMIRLLPERRRFAYMLFLGALSTHAPPELPAEELLG